MNEFPVTVEEFSREIEQPETRAAFLRLMRECGCSGVRSPREEWRDLLYAFRTKPVRTSWSEWLATRR